MIITHSPFETVTLLITHYNRSQSLERLLKSFQQLNCVFGAIIVSDDASKSEHLEYLKSIQPTYHFELVTTSKNGGLANNINKGQSAVKTPYTLYIQEDFDPKELFPTKLAQAIAVMDERPDVDMVRFYAYFKYPNLIPYKNGYLEMRFSRWQPGYKKFYQYSDHPHLRRKNFLEKFGRYEEGIPSDKAEYNMMMTFLKRKGKGLQYENINELLDQKNSSSEPSTVTRATLSTSNNIFISFIRDCYRLTKMNLNYFLGVRI